MTARTGQGNMQRPLIEIMLDGRTVMISKGNTCHSGEHTSHLNLTNSIQINTPWGQSTAVQNLEQSFGTVSLFRGHYSHREGTITGAVQQTISDAARWQLCADNDPATAGWNCDRGRQFAIQLITKDLDGGGIAWPRVPWSFAKGLDTHQIVGVVGGFKAVFHRPFETST